MKSSQIIDDAYVLNPLPQKTVYLLRKTQLS